MPESSVTSDSSTSSSSSEERLVPPPLPPVGGKKKLVLVCDNHVNKHVVAEFMSGISVLGDSAEIRENVSNLHGHLISALDALEQVLKHSSDDLSSDVKKLIVHYATLAKICEKLIEKMEGVPEFVNSDQSVHSSSQPQKSHQPEGRNK